MTRKISAITAVLAAVALGVAVFAAGPLGAHESDSDEYGRMPGYGMMGYGMGPDYGMGPGMMGYGMGPCAQARVGLDRDLSVEDVTKMLNRRLDRWGNERLKLGKVEEKDDDTIIAEILTVDDSVVQRLAIDRDTGRQRAIK